MKASTRLRELASVTETSLKKLEFKFEKNESNQLVEFDVTWPEPFLVRIVHLAEVEYPSAVFGMLLPGRQDECTDVRILFPDNTGPARQRSGELVKAILGSLKKPPWKGLGLISSGTSKALWTRAAEGRE